jgi:hypothetical protein
MASCLTVAVVMGVDSAECWVTQLSKGTLDAPALTTDSQLPLGSTSDTSNALDCFDRQTSRFGNPQIFGVLAAADR